MNLSFYLVLISSYGFCYPQKRRKDYKQNSTRFPKNFLRFLVENSFFMFLYFFYLPSNQELKY